MNDKILIIDHSHHFIDLLTTRLINQGHTNFRTAKTGKDGLFIADLEEPKLVLIDEHLPDVNSYRVCQQIKELHGDKMNVILMTGVADKAHMDMARQAEVDEYVMKTYDCLFLMAAIHRLLSRKQPIAAMDSQYHTLNN